MPFALKLRGNRYLDRNQQPPIEVHLLEKNTGNKHMDRLNDMYVSVLSWNFNLKVYYSFKHVITTVRMTTTTQMDGYQF